MRTCRKNLRPIRRLVDPKWINRIGEMQEIALQRSIDNETLKVKVGNKWDYSKCWGFVYAYFN